MREAAAAAGKSTSWIRDYLAAGVFETHQSGNGPVRLTSDSLFSFLRERENHAPKTRGKTYPHYLRLVVDNGAKMVLRGRPVNAPRLQLVVTDRAA